ncbi:hypothetical protein GWK47_028221 [Chionoecetes opilio]|uniref:Uncharacterized protein n=1 Tax=Chionoecetes opilio TaxID=41210 RepID=A0A8J4YM72_CHIOP|nr:hypothetical protein GWK47_028221 [Chionoecetes opilio]
MIDFGARGVPPLLNVLIHQLLSSDTNSSARGSAAASASRPKRLKITKRWHPAADRVQVDLSRSPPLLLCHRCRPGSAESAHLVHSPTRKVLRKETAKAPSRIIEPSTGHDAVLILHWEGKLLPGSESQGHVDRLAIFCHQSVLEGENSWYPCLAIRYRRSNGPAKSRRPSDTGSSKTSGGLCFDTTASNTGSMLAVAHSSNRS